MNLTLTFQISIYLLVSLSSIMFMMAEGGVFPQLITIPLGLITLFFTDRWEKFSLSPLGKYSGASGISGCVCGIYFRYRKPVTLWSTFSGLSDLDHSPAEKK